MPKPYHHDIRKIFLFLFSFFAFIATSSASSSSATNADVNILNVNNQLSSCDDLNHSMSATKMFLLICEINRSKR